MEELQAAHFLQFHDFFDQSTTGPFLDVAEKEKGMFKVPSKLGAKRQATVVGKTLSLV